MKNSCMVKRSFLILFLVLVVSSPLTVFARAGGGGGGGGGSYYSNDEGSSGSSFLSSIEFLGLVSVVAVVGSIIYTKRLNKKKLKSMNAIEDLARNDESWNYTVIKANIEETFYKVSEAWVSRNQEIARDYVSDKLFENHNMKIQEMIIEKEKNIIEDLQLLDIEPVGLNDSSGIEKDFLWVIIEAKALDYTIDEETETVISGNKSKVESYSEYWKFIKTPERWILDEIKQIGDIKIRHFDISVDK